MGLYLEDVDALYEKLKVLTNVDDAVKTAHIADIERKYKKNAPLEKQTTWKPVNEPDCDVSTEPVKQPEKMLPDEKVEARGDQQLLCPWCGKELVLRTAKKRNNAGRQFYGCSGFPKCRYVKNI